jgi:hypothetical protein
VNIIATMITNLSPTRDLPSLWETNASVRSNNTQLFAEDYYHDAQISDCARALFATLCIVMIVGGVLGNWMLIAVILR